MHFSVIRKNATYGSKIRLLYTAPLTPFRRKGGTGEMETEGPEKETQSFNRVYAMG